MMTRNLIVSWTILSSTWKSDSGELPPDYPYQTSRIRAPVTFQTKQSKFVKVVMVPRIFWTPDSGPEQAHPWEHEPCSVENREVAKMGAPILPKMGGAF